MGVDAADVVKVNGIAKASIDNINGYEFPGGGTILNTIESDSSFSQCGGIGLDITVYSSGTTISNAYSNSYAIYSDSTGTTYATGEWFYDDGTTTPYFQWSNATGLWVSTGPCSGLNLINSEKSSTACDATAASTVYSSGTTISNSNSNSYKLFTSSAGTTYASVGYYYNNGDETHYYYWSGTAWGTDATCLSIIYGEKSTTSCGIVSSSTVYTLGSSISDAYTNSYDIFTSSAGTTKMSSGYYYNNGYNTPYYYWNGSSWVSTAACTALTSRACEKSTASCTALSGSAVYTLGSSISNAYTNSYKIYTGSGRSLYMATGYYYDDATTTPYYLWNGTTWTSTGSCSSLNQIDVGHGSTSCTSPAEGDVYTSGTSISDAYDNSYDIFSTSAGDTYATSYYYFDSTNEYVCYYWSGATGDWGVKNSCLTAYAGSSIESTSSSACEIPKLGTWYHSGTVSYPTDNDYIFSDQWGESAASAGFQKFVYLMDRFIEIDSNGQVDGIAGTCV